MTCKDCVHYEVCPLGLVANGSTGTCLKFKNKADFVEVVRCKDCEYFIPDKYLNHTKYPNDLEADGLCDNIDKYTDENRYCSSAKRKESDSQ